ncbi:MAG TPA: class I SAM-dependent methyltransferase [Streptosporangiaceae bacterium]|jgi:SAM-dependent methyltransferase|nr:class I SAM-dependent methyltransferase [Streptosporangiaceae bacterium]
MNDIERQGKREADRTSGSARTDWLRLLLGDGPPDIATLWELCLGFEYDRDLLVDSLRGWLGAPGGGRILDCACGSGFPAIDLIRAGYDVTCSDGSQLMLGYFKRRTDYEGITARGALVRWEDLSDYFETPFDVVMCRGCALPYAGTWDDDAPPDAGALAQSVAQFAASLRPGGRLYVDTAAEPPGDDPQVTTHPTLAIGPHRIDLAEELSLDRTARLRRWRCQLTIDGRDYEFQRRSHYLPPSDLAGLLAGAGLTDVRPERLPGERYAVLTAVRPEE